MSASGAGDGETRTEGEEYVATRGLYEDGVSTRLSAMLAAITTATAMRTHFTLRDTRPPAAPGGPYDGHT